MRAALATRWSGLLTLAERRLPALTRLKQPEALPITLHRQRIYVLPTRFGLAFSLILLVMLIGALNYNNNPAMLLTCLLGAAAYQSVFQAFRTINRLELRALKALPCSAGDTLRLSIIFHSGSSARQGLRLRLENATPEMEIVFDVGANEVKTLNAELPAPRRGWQASGRIRTFTEYPFGLFQVWSWLNPDFRTLVYPRAEADAPALPQAGGEVQAQAQHSAGDELAALRDYRPSDPRRRIAWKASARHDRLLVKEFEQPRGSEIVLDWHALDGLDYEARIARLAAWVGRAEGARTPYLLALAHTRIGPGLGAEHRHACLRELALLPEATP
jgi:uncharacterized protein (DUF58 family)